MTTKINLSRSIDFGGHEIFIKKNILGGNESFITNEEKILASWLKIK